MSERRAVYLNGEDAGFVVAWSVAGGWVMGFWPSYAVGDGIPPSRRTGVVTVSSGVPPEQPYRLPATSGTEGAPSVSSYCPSCQTIRSGLHCPVCTAPEGAPDA